MNLSNIANIRLNTQQIAGSKYKTAKDVVAWMGGMQAQDYAMAKWALGIRLPGSTNTEIENALNKGEIIRTHLMRPTWHFVSPDDVYWMQELTAPQIKILMKSRDKELELTEKIYTKSNTIIEKKLLGGNHLTRDELMVELKKAKIKTDEYRSGHIMLRAELDGIVCSGAIKNKKQTYALLEERVPKIKKLNKDEALAKLATSYFSSHCPATLKDFSWWSGLSMSNAKHALEMIKPDFVSEKIGEEIYWLTNSFFIPESKKTSIYMLPAYDEFIISYKDRSATLILEHQKKAFSSNGIFYPSIIMNGQAIGIWKRTIKKDKVIIETDLFKPLNKTTKSLIEKAAVTFGNFLEKETRVLHKVL